MLILLKNYMITLCECRLLRFCKFHLDLIYKLRKSIKTNWDFPNREIFEKVNETVSNTEVAKIDNNRLLIAI